MRVPCESDTHHSCATEGQAARLEGSRRNQIAEGPAKLEKVLGGDGANLKGISKPTGFIDKARII